MKKILIIILLNVFYSSYCQIPVGSFINGINSGDNFGQSVAINSNGNVVIVGAPNSDIGASNSGQAIAYSYDNGSWSQLGNTINGDESNANYGSSVATSADGSVIAIGGPNKNENNNNDSGIVKIYNLNSNSWYQKGNTIIGTQANQFLGASISLSADGNRIAVGSPNYQELGYGYGKVEIYELLSGIWSLLGNAIVSSPNDIFFGNNIALSKDGSTIVISDYNYNSNSLKIGKIKIYNFQNGNWQQKGNSILGNLSEDDLPHSVSISSNNNLVAIGIPGSDSENGTNSGMVKVYEFNGTDWIQKGNSISGTSSNQMLGFSQSLSGDGNKIIVGSPNYNNLGKLSFYDFILGNWQQLGNDLVGLNTNDFFAISCSISDNHRAVVGVYQSDVSGNDSGQVGVFDYQPLLETECCYKIYSNVFSNPVKDKLLVLEDNKDSISLIKLYDVSGRFIRYLELDSNNSVDVSFLTKGVYFIEFQKNNKIKAVEKIIKS